MANYDLHQIGGSGPKAPGEKRCEDLERVYRQMLRIRAFEEKCAAMYKEGKIRGFCHLAVGQEGIPVGMLSVLDKADVVITSYRCHAYALLKGMSEREAFCELVGARGGCSGGRGGSMHLYWDGFLGGNGIVGAQVPLGLGAAFAENYRRNLENPCPGRGTEDDRAHDWAIAPWKKLNCRSVSVAIFGDGAANQGQVFESYNMAKLWNLPIIFVCENNMYGMGTGVNRASGSASFYDRVSFIPGVRVDGTDVFSVEEAFAFAREHALTKGPLVVEVLTYRYSGHSMTDSCTSYRMQKEVSEREEHDCIKRIRARLQPHLGAGQLDEIDRQTRLDVDAAAEEAERSARCAPSMLYENVLLKP